MKAGEDVLDYTDNQAVELGLIPQVTYKKTEKIVLITKRGWHKWHQ